MPRLTGGEGWSLSSEEEPGKKSERKCSQSPKPNVRMENRPGGKKVTLIAGLHTYGERRLFEIAHVLKSRCGTGGTVKDGQIELQGDQRAAVRKWMEKEFVSKTK